ncbi:class I SAM-dependent RNA methyltransferase, partial [Candidatus Woesearchaeota archaeon]|nr:class I SAM-dependent RNA methyltransferase [Candidatus Woesearchaeota archaeon]
NKRKQLFHATGFEHIRTFASSLYFYRSRMDFLVDENIGLRGKQGVVDVEKCVISNERINILLTEVRNFIHALSADERTTIHEFSLRAPPEDNGIVFVLDQQSSFFDDALGKLRSFADSSSASQVVVQYDETILPLKGAGFLQEAFLGKTFFYPIVGFFQNNPVLANEMHSYCREILQTYPTKDAHFLDLYSGVGTFGIVNADLFQTVTLVESYPLAVPSAEKNIEVNNATNVRMISLDAEHLKRVDLQKPLYVLVDPPRSGMDEKTITSLKQLQPEVIIYISCNVEQLKKDARKFKKYAIKSVALFDFFPQTNHMENVVEFALK